MSARDRILGRVRKALTERAHVDHPGDFEGWRAEEAPPPVEAFIRTFEAAGGEVVQISDTAEAGAWLTGFCADFGSASVGGGVPDSLRPSLPDQPPQTAELGVSMARCAIGETGSLVLGAEDGRLTQLLPPTHVVFVHASDAYATLREALLALRESLPSAIGLHSGPSKSADIGQILVKGVHGPGRVVAVLIGASS